MSKPNFPAGMLTTWHGLLSLQHPNLKFSNFTEACVQSTQHLVTGLHRNGTLDGAKCCLVHLVQTTVFRCQNYTRRAGLHCEELGASAKWNYLQLLVWILCHACPQIHAAYQQLIWDLCGSQIAQIYTCVYWRTNSDVIESHQDLSTGLRVPEQE